MGSGLPASLTFIALILPPTVIVSPLIIPGLRPTPGSIKMCTIHSVQASRANALYVSAQAMYYLVLQSTQALSALAPFLHSFYVIFTFAYSRRPGLWAPITVPHLQPCFAPICATNPLYRNRPRPNASLSYQLPVSSADHYVGL